MLVAVDIYKIKNEGGNGYVLLDDKIRNGLNLLLPRGTNAEIKYRKNKNSTWSF